MAKRRKGTVGGQRRSSIARSGEGRATGGGRGASAGVSGPVGRLSVPVGPAQEAVSAFERGMQLMQRHAFAEAAQQFRALLDSFAGDGGLRDRSEVYLALCERELRRRPAGPETLEERLTAATAALNNGDDDAAERLAREVLGENPDHDLALYLLAAVEARRGAATAALRMLAQAIDIRPDIRAQARHDADFEMLRGLEAFQLMIEAPSHPPGNGGRGKTRRAR